MDNKVSAARAMVFAAVLSTLLTLPALGGAAPAAAATAAAGSGNCTRTCGDMSIPYPFGMEPGCYHAAGFNLSCRYGELFLGDGSSAVQVFEISVEHSVVRINSTRVDFPGDDRDGITPNRTWGDSLPQGGPYFLSESVSIVQAIGCGIQVSILGGEYNDLASSCTAICPSMESTTYGFMGNGTCMGNGCCQANILAGYSFYNVQINRLPGAPPYSLAVYLIDHSFNFTYDMITDDLEQVRPKGLPATLDWVMNTNSTACPTNTSAPECRSAHSYCHNSSTYGHGGYSCRCSAGFQGNPYVIGGCQDINECKSPGICYGNCTNTLGSFICQCNKGYKGDASVPNGCKDIDECEHQEEYSCYGICQNFPGSFHCQCLDGTYGDSSIKGGCIAIKNSFTGLSIGLGVGGGTGLLVLALGGPYIMRKIKLQKVKKIKQKFFKQNHGLLLQKLISQNTDIGEKMIITLKDLEKATNNFDRERIIGGGGHGVVFKGILDLHVVAIKRSKIVVQREINEFINEVAVLSKVNHRNVVKLLGCCLETEVPLLVYEFISNGTLSHHLHMEGSVSISWDNRIRIATEVAKALSYLHSSASMPIFHRDIKSSNILLDDYLTAKVSDFGASRYFPMDQTGVTTAIQGTMGYLDPMYYYTGRLTDKSDVFSFGVLLVELLTRKKPYVYRSTDNDGLVSHFVSLLTEGKLIDILDPQVMEEEEEDGEIQNVAILAATCTKLKGENRPTMREVEMTLESLLVKKRHVLSSGIATRHGRNEATSYYTATDRDIKEASRQYTMEEEILLSASYPR